jgi:hypothetical protein
MKKAGPLVAMARPSSGSIYVVLIIGGPKDNHFHVEVATAEYTHKRLGESPDKPPSKMADIRRAFQRVRGERAVVFINAGFELNPEQFPSIITSTLVEAKYGDVRMQTTGGRIDVTGAPIERIIWSKQRDADRARVNVRARKSVVLNDNYLVDALDFVSTAFNAIVLREE